MLHAFYQILQINIFKWQNTIVINLSSKSYSHNKSCWLSVGNIGIKSQALSMTVLADNDKNRKEYFVRNKKYYIAYILFMHTHLLSATG